MYKIYLLHMCCISIFSQPLSGKTRCHVKEELWPTTAVMHNNRVSNCAAAAALNILCSRDTVFEAVSHAVLTLNGNLSGTGLE